VKKIYEDTLSVDQITAI